VKSRKFVSAIAIVALVATGWFYFGNQTPIGPSILIPVASSFKEPVPVEPSASVLDATMMDTAGAGVSVEREAGANVRGRTPAQTMIERDAYDELPLIDSLQEAPDSKGVFKRARLVKDLNKKYSQILVEELWQVTEGSNKLKSRVSMVGDHLIVQIKDGVRLEEFERAIDKMGAKIRKAMSTQGLYLVEFEAKDVGSLRRMMDALRQSPLVKFPEPDYVVGL
jgi:hypothetical protein